MHSIDWNSLRALNGSQRHAFEALCCQLAACEPVPLGAQFIRVGAPDAGVECYWILPNSDEYAWQAQFFTATPDKTQWGEVDESVKTALEKHPRLVRYTICFPLDRADPRRERERWFMDKWHQHVDKWKGWAREKGMAVAFDYWGEHDLLLRLSQEEHQGRFFFWFHNELFSDRWFAQRLDESISAAGPRYTPHLNVDLSIARLFDGLGRTAAFFKRLEAEVLLIKRAYRSISRYRYDPTPKEMSGLEQNMQELSSLTQFDQQNSVPIDWGRLKQVVASAYAEASSWVEKVERSVQERLHMSSSAAPEIHQDARSAVIVSNLHELMRVLRNLERLVGEDEARLVNDPALLLVGKAGTGKTHLFCDIAQQRQQNGGPTILLLGEKFRNSEPWLQIRSLLALSCERDEFLGALNAAGEARRQRVLILIDALNEGEGKQFWRNFLAEILVVVSRYPWLGIAVSVRTSYEEVIVPDGLVPGRLVRVVHEGFAEHEHEATKVYFDYYGIERPSIPLLLPEFRNPLFLKLFCQGLQAGHYTRIPEGLRGISNIFAFFLDNLNRKLARVDELDFNPNVPHVHKAVEMLTRALAEKGANWLPHQEAQAIVDNIVPPRGYEGSLFRRLITEGVLSEDRFPERDGNRERFRYVEGIRFAYERLSDHLIAQHLLDNHLDPEHPREAFELGQPLGRLVSSKPAQWQNRGLIEAFSIQLPERLSEEPCELVPAESIGEVIRVSLVESLLWRDPGSITKKTLQSIERHVWFDGRAFRQFLEVLLIVAMHPGHRLNADYLHTILRRQTMAKRDTWWSTFLYDQFDNGMHSPVNRLLDWACNVEESVRIADEPLRLASMTICWFLTTSHRPLRDRATKSLVRLLGARLQLLRRLLATFTEVDEPYVIERLYAVAYGCAMRTQDRAGLRELAEDVYHRVFDTEWPPSNILLRDHARGIIERALALGLDVVVEREKIRPPYRNTWPEDIPSQQEVEQLLGVDERADQEIPFKERGRFALYFLMMGLGDFTRYVIGADSASHKWLARRLVDTNKPTRREEYRQFMASLTTQQLNALDRYRKAYWEVQHGQLLQELSHFLPLEEEVQIEHIIAAEELAQAQEPSLEEAWRRLQCVLGKRKIDLFEQKGFSWFTEPDELGERLDLKLFHRWIAKCVFELGWTVEAFGEFDAIADRRENRSGGRSPDKPERIGKKYQWIAYYDILARATDTFVFRDDYWNDGGSPYEGPWQFSSVRNIDPSFLLENTLAHKGMTNISTGSWWYLPSPPWHTELDDKHWLPGCESLPDPRSFIEVTHPVGTSIWLTLYGLYSWRQPVQPEEKGNGPQGREVWYFLESCLVKRGEADRLFNWSKRNDFSEIHLPEPIDWDNIYIGELYWSPCYHYYYNSARHFREWTRGDGKFPVPITLTTERYSWAKGYDCSIEETVSCAVPSKFLVDGMKLFWNGLEGHYVTADGMLAAFDPSVRERGPSALLVKKETLLRFLQDNDLAVLWTIRGEKNAYGNGNWPDSFAGRFTISGAYMYSEHGSLQGKLILKDSLRN